MTGVLHGVGLGPGAPDLITLRAARLIAGAQVLAWPRPAGGHSLARAIVADLIPDAATEIAIDLPMTPERGPAQAAYDRAAAEIAEHLAAGRDVVTLCEGDPLFYGSFMYLVARLARRFAVQVTPGVTSVSAAAAAARLPLVARDQRLITLPGPLPDADLRAGIIAADAVAIMKIGRHLPRIRTLIADLGLTARATFVSHATQGAELVSPLAQAPATAPYFSMILIAKESDPWL